MAVKPVLYLWQVKSLVMACYKLLFVCFKWKSHVSEIMSPVVMRMTALEEDLYFAFYVSFKIMTSTMVKKKIVLQILSDLNMSCFKFK